MLARWNVPQAQIEAGRAVRGQADELDQSVPTIWPAHLDAARIFGAMRRQWRVLVGPKGDTFYLGLDFNALGEVRRMLRIRPRPELMDQLRTMEAEGAEALNEKG